MAYLRVDMRPEADDESDGDGGIMDVLHLTWE